MGRSNSSALKRPRGPRRVSFAWVKCPALQGVLKTTDQPLECVVRRSRRLKPDPACGIREIGLPCMGMSARR
jgi:hypothetical protein